MKTPPTTKLTAASAALWKMQARVNAISLNLFGYTNAAGYKVTPAVHDGTLESDLLDQLEAVVGTLETAMDLIEEMLTGAA